MQVYFQFSQNKKDTSSLFLWSWSWKKIEVMWCLIDLLIVGCSSSWMNLPAYQRHNHIETMGGHGPPQPFLPPLDGGPTWLLPMAHLIGLKKIAIMTFCIMDFLGLMKSIMIIDLIKSITSHCYFHPIKNCLPVHCFVLFVHGEALFRLFCFKRKEIHPRVPLSP